VRRVDRRRALARGAGGPAGALVAASAPHRCRRGASARPGERDDDGDRAAPEKFGRAVSQPGADASRRRIV